MGRLPVQDSIWKERDNGMHMVMNNGKGTIGWCRMVMVEAIEVDRLEQIKNEFTGHWLHVFVGS